jgi:hypothetical protein
LKAATYVPPILAEHCGGPLATSYSYLNGSKGLEILGDLDPNEPTEDVLQAKVPVWNYT